MGHFLWLSWQEGRCLLSFHVSLVEVVRGHLCLLLGLQLCEISIKGEKYCQLVTENM